MDSLAPTSRLLSWLRTPAAGRPGLRVEQLEDRTVPSTSIPLSGLGWTPIGGTIVGAVASDPILPVAGRVNSVATPGVPFNPGQAGFDAVANTVFAGTPGGGLARSTDNGVTWQFLTDNLDASVYGGPGQDANRILRTGAIGVNPLDTNPADRLVLVGTGESGFPDVATFPQGFLLGGSGILRSTDSGNTFTMVTGPGNDFVNSQFEKFVFHPTNRDIVFAVVNGPGAGVYRSIDRGVTWVTVSDNIPNAGTFNDLILDPTNPAVAYVTVTGAGIFRTANFLNTTGGPQPAAAAITYTQVLGGTGTSVPGASLQFTKMAFGLGTPNQPSRIYAISASSLFNGPSNQLFRSDDSGINFRRLDPAPDVLTFDAFYNLEIIPDPTSPNRVFFSGRGARAVQVLTNADYNPDAGQTPNYVNLPLPDNSSIRNVRAIQFDNTGVKDISGRAVDPGRLLVATDAGLYRFQAAGGRATLISDFTSGSVELVSLNGAPGPDALFVQEYYATALAPRTDNLVLGGTNGNGQTRFVDNGPVPVGTPAYNNLFYHNTVTGPDTRGTGQNIVFSQIDPNLVYRTSNYLFESQENDGGLFQRSTDGGASWTTSIGGILFPTTTYPPQRNPFNIFNPTAFIADPAPQIGTAEARLFLGTRVINQSFNGGQTWTQFGPDLPFVTPQVPNGFDQTVISAIGRSVASALTATNRIYVAVSDRVGTLPGAPGPSSFGPGIYRFEIPPPGVTPFFRDVSPGVLDGRLPPTMDAPAFPQANNLQGQVVQIIVDPTDQNIVYAITTSTGAGRVLRSINGGLSWTDLTPATSGLPGASARGSPGLSVYSIALDPNLLTVTNNPANPFTQSDDSLYIGTSLGVWVLTNPTNPNSTWSRVADAAPRTGTDDTPGKLPDVRVFDVELNTTTGVLSAGTFGRGMWQIQIRPFVRGQVFLDTNGDGDNANDVVTPVPGAVVLAINVSNPPSEVQFANTTAAPVSGEYIFRSLPDATYRFDPANASRDLIDPSTQYFITGQTITEAVDETKFLSGRDLFVFDRINISGVVYEDENGNGVRDAGEAGLAGFIVQLTDPSTGTPINDPQATVTTDANGAYTFAGVAPLRPNLVTPAGAPPDSNAQLPGGYQVVPAAVQPLFAGEPGFNLTQTPAVTGALTSNLNLTDALNEGQTRLGVFQFARLSGTVFDDFNGDGVRQPTEAGLAGLTVQLVDAGGNVVTATTTPGGGAYSFGGDTTSLTAGAYRVVVLPPPGFAQTTAGPPAITVTSGDNTVGVDVGLFAAAAIRGALYEDVNANGVRDASENTFVPGLEVSLVDPRTNTVFASTTTDGLGNYSFAGLFPLERPGNTVPFLVRFTNPLAVYSQTSADGAVGLTSGTAFTQVNLGVFRNTTVSGFAFDDTNGDGVRQLGEPGLASGSVSLLNSQTGAVVYTTTTDAAGNFLFPNVGAIPGPVPFRVGPPAVGFVQTTPNPPDFFVTSGTPVGGFVIGLFRNAAFTGTVFEDVNGNGLPETTDPRLPGQTVQLVDAAGAVVQTAVTDGNGAYTLTAGPGTFRTVHLVPAGFVQTNAAYPPVTTTSGRVVADQNYGDFRLFATTGRVFNDLNGNGSGAGDPGLAGVVVQVVNTATGAVAATATTDAAGNYTLPLLGPGTYRVQAVGGPNRVATTATSRTFAASSGQPQVTDFGFFTQAAVTGTVFEDVDRSGAVSAGDGFPAGITVQLLGAGNAVLATAVTGANGTYSFPNLAPGTYRVQVQPPAGFTTVLNGTQTVTLVSGQTLAAAPIGVLRFGSVSGTVFLDPNRNTRRDAPERGVGGATVGLFSVNTQIATQTTDANGAYTFFGVDAGTYTVRIVGNPTGFQPTGAGLRSVTLTLGSATPSNAATGIDFGLTGRDRYALAADGGGGPRVQVYDALSNSLLQDFFVYEQTFTGGVRVATGDVNGDGVDDLIVVPGKGGGPRVRVLDGVTQNAIYDYFAYEPTFRNGLFVTSADVNGDGFSDLITGTEAGGGPRVTVFSGRTGTILADYFAFDENFRGGVRVGSGDVDGDGVAEILTSPGAGGGPTVIAWSLLSGQPAAVVSFNAFDENYTGGIYVAGSTTGPNGRSNIIVGSGGLQPFANVSTPVVRVFDTERFVATAEIEAFPGGVDPEGYQSEVRVASFDRTGDGIPDIAVANGPGNYPRFRFLDGANRRPIGEETQPYEFGFTGGIFVG